MRELQIALEQAEYHVEDRNYDEWARSAFIASSNMTKPKKVTDLIGEHPSKKREREKKKEAAKQADKDKLRQIALDKGLDPSF